MRRARRHPLTVLGALAALTTGGLVAGLVGDGGWDLAGVAALAVPVVAIGVALVRPARRSAGRASLRAGGPDPRGD